MRLAGVIAWHRNPADAVLSRRNECRWQLALIQNGETELLLKEAQRTKEEMGNVKL